MNTYRRSRLAVAATATVIIQLYLDNVCMQ